jgi:hypothetical protein
MTLAFPIGARWRRIAALLLACTALASPAAAQGDDRAYCGQLAGMVQRYVGSTGSGTSVMPNPTIIWAMEQCRWGDATAAIPILERKLLDYQLTLPKR